jgi:hypothetical protein
MNGNGIDLSWLREIYREDDRLRAEREEEAWMARREAERAANPLAESEVADARVTGNGLCFGAPVETEPTGSPLIRRNVEADDLARKAHGTPPAAAAEPDGGASDEMFDIFGDWRDGRLRDAIGEVISHERARTRKEITAALAARSATLGNLQIAHDRLLGRCIDLRRDLAEVRRQIIGDRREWRAERKLLQEQIATLRKRLDATDTVERDSVVDLPDWRKRHA